MANYVKATDFASKDALLSGDPAKIIKGTEIDSEFNAIATAVSTKADTVSPTFTGTPLAPTAAPGTNNTQIATTAFVTAADTAAITAERSATATLTNKTLTSPIISTISNTGTLTLPTSTDTLVGRATTDTLTNKTLTSPVLTTPSVDVINEATAGAGVTVDGVLIKDGVIAGGAGGPTLETAKATTSGTSIDFTGIPSWVKRITILFYRVSTDNGADLLIQLGDAGGIETSGYQSASGTSGGDESAINGFIVYTPTTSTLDSISGSMTIIKISGNRWVSSHSVCSDSGGTRHSAGGGSKELSDTLTQIRITNDASGTFDAGSVNILYE